MKQIGIALSLPFFAALMFFSTPSFAYTDGYVLATYQSEDSLQLRYLWPDEVSVGAVRYEIEQMMENICKYKMDSTGILMLIYRMISNDGVVTERVLRLMDCSLLR